MKRSLWMLIALAAAGASGWIAVAHAQRGLWSLSTELTPAGASAFAAEPTAPAAPDHDTPTPQTRPTSNEELWVAEAELEDVSSDPSDLPTAPVGFGASDGVLADTIPAGPGLDFRRFQVPDTSSGGETAQAPPTEDIPQNVVAQAQYVAEDSPPANSASPSFPPPISPGGDEQMQVPDGDLVEPPSELSPLPDEPSLGPPSVIGPEPVVGSDDVGSPAESEQIAPGEMPSEPEGMFFDAAPLAPAEPNRAVPVDDTIAPSSERSSVPPPEPVDEAVLGPQTPSLALEKIAPSVVNLGEPVHYEIVVKNVGSSPAYEVVVQDRVPEGTRLLDTDPPTTGPGEPLIWELGTLGPAKERRIAVQVQPLREGPIVSVAHVTFSARAAARTLVAQPRLDLEISSPPQVRVGEPLTFSLHISNPGTGAATGVVVQERLPVELSHPDGNELEYEVGTLEPGQTEVLTLTVTAARRGRAYNQATAIGDGNLKATAEAYVQIVGPELAVEINGPRRRYLERPALYTVTVANPGDASISSVHVVSHVPEGMELLDVSHGGQFDPQRGTVAWQLPELGPGAPARLNLSLVPVAVGEKVHVVEAAAGPDLQAQSQLITLVEGVSAILFEVVDVDDPVEVGAETTYEIRVLNQGSKAATNVRVVAEAPSGIQLLNGNGPTEAVVQENQIQFAPLEQLGPGADAIFRVQARGLQPGDHRIKVEVLTDQMQTPVREEESTRVYAD